MNANTTNIKQVFGPEKLSGLLRNGPQDRIEPRFKIVRKKIDYLIKMQSCLTVSVRK